MDHLDALRQRESVAQIALAAAEQRHVDGQHDRAMAGLDREADELLARLTFAEVIELEPPRSRRRRGDVLEPRARRGRDGVERARSGRAASGRELAIGVRDLVERGRGEQDRVGKVHSEQRRPQVARRDVDEHAITELAPPERRAVRRDRPLVLGAAGDEVVGHRRQCVACDVLELVQIQMVERIHAPQASRPSRTMR